MVLKRSAPARRCASAAVSSGSTATGAAWGWRERNVKVRSSTMPASTSTATSRATRIPFTIHHSLVCGGARKWRDGARPARGPGGAGCPVVQFIDYTALHDLELRLRRRALFPDGPHRAGTGDLLDRRLSHRRAARGLGTAQPRPRRATAGFQPRGAAMRHHPSPRGSLRKPRPARGRAADYAPGTRDWRVATRRGGHPFPAVPPRRLGRPAAGPRRAARRGPRDVAIPIPGYSHPRPRNGPCGPVRARARLALFGRPVSRPPAPLPPRRRRRVRDDGLVAAGAGARAAGAVLPAPRARGAGRGTAARQARLPGRAGRADPRAARARVERRSHRACAPGERPLVAGVDRRGVVGGKLRAGIPATRLRPF